ncbi:MAG TPA: hypothetical protein VG167_04295 [Verrucomicrobiae bacterium]|nr:hypothetical protein [Verrucomicrobiae bacterium]
MRPFIFAAFATLSGVFPYLYILAVSKLKKRYGGWLLFFSNAMAALGGTIFLIFLPDRLWKIIFQSQAPSALAKTDVFVASLAIFLAIFKFRATNRVKPRS